MLRDELAWRSHGLDSSFHATTDQQYVRDRVFEVLSHLNFRFDVTLLEKRKDCHLITTSRFFRSRLGFRRPGKP